MHLVLLLLLMQASLAATGLALLAWWRNPSTASAIQYAIFSLAMQLLLVIDQSFLFSAPPVTFPQTQSIHISIMVLLWIILIMFCAPQWRKRLFGFQLMLIFGILTLQFMITGYSMLTVSTSFLMEQFVPDRDVQAVVWANVMSMFCNTLAASVMWVAVIYAAMQGIRFLRHGPRSGRDEQMAIFIRFIRVALLARFMVPLLAWAMLAWLDHFEAKIFFGKLIWISGSFLIIRYLYGLILPLLIADYAGLMLENGKPRIAAVSILTLPFMILIAEVLAAGLTVGWRGVSF